jgi:hypothetical protein
MTTSRHLQREAELHRRELSSSLDGLRTAATPSYVTTEVLNLAKDSSLSIAKALAEQARANPILGGEFVADLFGFHDFRHFGDRVTAGLFHTSAGAPQILPLPCGHGQCGA